MLLIIMTMIIMMMKQRCDSVVRTDLLRQLVQWWRFLKVIICNRFSRNILYSGIFFVSDSTVSSLTTGNICMYVTMRHVRVTIVALEEQYVSYSRCVFVTLVIQHVKCMRHIVICGLSGSTAFFEIVINSTIFGKPFLNIKKCFFSSTFVWNLSHSRKNWERYLHKYTLVFV
jgi:hypothetical protein